MSDSSIGFICKTCINFENLLLIGLLGYLIFCKFPSIKVLLFFTSHASMIISCCFVLQSFHLLIPVEGLFTTNKYQGSLETALDDQHEGKSYINIWTNAFHDAFTRICPVQAGGHKCGCLPVLTKLV